ncbi:MAG: hypothetical protein F4X22_13195 [Gemmatimonadales bacterium]|nr:hypothetical protein [Candidatus Palauibacter denitrificans]
MNWVEEYVKVEPLTEPNGPPLVVSASNPLAPSACAPTVIVAAQSTSSPGVAATVPMEGKSTSRFSLYERSSVKLASSLIFLPSSAAAST